MSGHVTREDGSPLAGARVVFKSLGSGATVNGKTDDNGRYQLATTAQKTGMPLGEYTVMVIEDRGDWDHEAPRTVHENYGAHHTSGLKCSVEAETVFDMQLNPPAG